MESRGCKNRRSDVDLPLLLLTVCLAASLVPAVGSEEKVKVTVFYEALCPSCEDFIVNYLYKIFDNGVISIVDLKLSPYGNAKLRSNGTIVCQHGEWECLLNTVEACAIHTWPVVSDHFPFIFCVESLNYQGKYAEWETCFQKLNLDPKPITDCYSSGFGHQLELQYADEIKVLEPPHEYVPWVVLNGKPLYEDYPNFESFICKAYKGSNVPQACLGLSHPVTTPKYSVKRFNHVCYKEDDNAKSKSTLSEIISLTAASWMQHVAM